MWTLPMESMLSEKACAIFPTVISRVFSAVLLLLLFPSLPYYRDTVMIALWGQKAHYFAAKYYMDMTANQLLSFFLVLCVACLTIQSTSLQPVTLTADQVHLIDACLTCLLHKMQSELLCYSCFHFCRTIDHLHLPLRQLHPHKMILLSLQEVYYV